MRYKKLSIIGLGTIVVSFPVLALIWRSSASYLSLIPVFLAGAGMAGLFTTQFVTLLAPSREGMLEQQLRRITLPSSLD